MVIELGTKPSSNIEIITPLIKMSKSQIVKQGMEIGAPFELSWSCYEQEAAACGLCDSCRLRLKAFAEAGYSDPIPYITKP